MQGELLAKSVKVFFQANPFIYFETVQPNGGQNERKHHLLQTFGLAGRGRIKLRLDVIKW